MQPRLGATWAYNGKDTVYASYATYNPAASSLPRAASWDRNLFVTLNNYFDPNGVLIGNRPARLVFGQAVRPGSDAAHDLRDTGRHLEAVQPALVRRASTGATAAASTSGRTRTTPRGCRRRRVDSIRRPASRASCTSRTWTSNARRSASTAPTSSADRPTSSPSSTAPSRSTTRARSKRSGRTTRRSCAARIRGATTTATSTRTARASPTTRTSSSARRTSATAPGASCGTTATAICAAIAVTC